METRYSIKDLARLSGIKAHTIRAWEQRYGLLEPFRTSTNIRYYADEHLKRILNAAVLVKNGMRISNVASLSNDELHSAVISANAFTGSYETHIGTLKMSMLEYDEYMFESAFNNCLKQFGAERTLAEIVGPFIREIGLLWQANAITVSHEHFVSNLIKQKLYSIIDQTVLSRTSSEQSGFILYLPGDELHELGLLYLYFYLRAAGKRVVYLGQSVPLEYLKDVAEKTGIKRFVSVFTLKPHADDIDTYFENIGKELDSIDYEFFVTGIQAQGFDPNSHSGRIHISKDLAALKANLFSHN